ncbi:MAG: RIP metalloprotease RseP [Proteobacteria bacterium]|jgi:regulator of sigma E protease|uniref:Zinc metalloprotease n=1 Tax=SAR86 cluster bacterium TaxID=2030880 RepID=A0A937I8U2_9GAMM|nr:RIP metalloprotease RseP [SAR86 cluster bacterium]MDA0774832.1 RIP metalloprotease RseP [Pseudomonadota bacterium]MDA0975955.1 RIP metalloprotease RseP [Pseudomonadota bacterium]MDA1037659.1 RIP metalloprotease RseP [Pseudomonadota bacterium]
MTTTLIYIGSFIALLGVLITIHEYGHFIFARIFKVHVQRFSIGMGPVIYKRLDKYGTEFAISAFPLGGYVSMITNKLLEVEPEIKEQLTEEQIQSTFDSKPKWQRALIMFAGPLANFLLSIFIFSLIFLNTPDPQTKAVIKTIDSSIIMSSEDEFILPGDEIYAINSLTISDPKDINLELLSYAGYTGAINLSLKRPEIDDLVNVAVVVKDFLPTSESQSNPLQYMGLSTEYKMKPIIGNLVKSGPADAAGLKNNDLISKIGNKEINYASDIRAAVSSIPNQNVLIDIYRDGDFIQLPISIGSSIDKNGKEIGILGISFGTNRTFIQSISKGVYETYNLSVKTFQFIGKMVTGNMGTENLSGPIGIAQMAGNTAQAGFLPFMYLMALLSISLGVLNLLPIPVLDGGQLTLLGIEAIRGKPLPEKVENYIYTGGILMVGALMIFAIFNDVSRFF